MPIWISSRTPAEADRAAEGSAPSAGHGPEVRAPGSYSIGLALVVAPFLYYFYVLDWLLRPVVFPDAFAYLWLGPINFHYLTGRSLTQRFLYTLLGNHALLIVNVQLAALLGAAVSVYLALRRRHWFPNLLLAGAVAFFFSSYTLNVIAIDVIPEPIHIALLVVFQLVLFSPPGGAAPSLLLFVAGVPFIFSRNTAPYLVLFQVALFLVLRGWRAPRPAWRRLAVLALLALVSIGITWSFDTSLYINVVNNVYLHVFSDLAVTEHFHARLGMPVGPFVERCKAENVMSLCLDGRPIFRIRERSRNYVLTDDRYGFLDWVRRRGRQAWTRYLLWDALPRTLGAFEAGFRSLYAGDSIEFFNSFYLAYKPPPDAPSNYAVLSRLRPGGNKGFLGIEPLEVTKALLVRLGFARPPVVGLYLAAGVALGLLVADNPFLRLGVATMATALVLFFLGYFGDPMELHRHVIPALLLFTLAAVSYLAGLAGAGLAVARTVWLRRRLATA